MSTPEVTIFIPVFNEEDLLICSSRKVHDYLAARNVSHEILVVSNGSTDDTITHGNLLQTQESWFKFAAIPEKGPGRAFKSGLKMARGEVIICLDIDLSSHLSFIDCAIDLIKYAEMVVGSKTMGKQRRTLRRVLGSQAYLLFTQFLFDLSISDYSMGCKAFRRNAIIDILDHLDNWTGYIFEISLYLNSHQKRILQVGVDCEDLRNSRFNLFYEGYYRFTHLYKYWRALKQSNCWINK